MGGASSSTRANTNNNDKGKSYEIDGIFMSYNNWSGGVDSSMKLHGSGTITHGKGDTTMHRLCTVRHGIVQGCHLEIWASGIRNMAVCNNDGIKHGVQVRFHSNGDVDVKTFENGRYVNGKAGTSLVHQYNADLIISHGIIRLLQWLRNVRFACII
jgi:hypothetical protein